MQEDLAAEVSMQSFNDEGLESGSSGRLLLQNGETDVLAGSSSTGGRGLVVMFGGNLWRFTR